jgi:hypothetical protein
MGTNMWQHRSHSRRLRVASGATTPGPTLEGAACFRPKVVFMSLSGYIFRYIGNADTCCLTLSLLKPRYLVQPFDVIKWQLAFNSAG